MRIQGIAVIALLTASAFAKDPIPKVRQAWVRTYPQSWLGIQPDNIGHVLVSGRSGFDAYEIPTNSVLFLLDRHGKEIASATGSGIDEAAIVADNAGRIFVCSANRTNARVRCTAFAPRLAGELWSNDRGMNNAIAPSPFVYFYDSIPDEAGGVYVLGSLSQVFNPQLFLMPFDEANTTVTAFWYSSQRSYPLWAADIVRAPNGIVYWICNITALGHYSAPVIISYTPGTSGGGVGGYVGLSSSWYSAAACDKDSNLVLVGGYQANTFDRGPTRCVIAKRDAEGNGLWWITHTNTHNGAASFVAVDLGGNIIVRCGHGTTKYTPDGQMLWQMSETGLLQIDRDGNIFLIQQVTDEFGVETPVTIKLSPNGCREWQAQIDEDQRPESSYASGLVCDDEGGAYVAIQRSQGTTIVRFVEHGPKASH
jgi:hypothetical protein